MPPKRVRAPAGGKKPAAKKAKVVQAVQVVPYMFSTSKNVVGPLPNKCKSTLYFSQAYAIQTGVAGIAGSQVYAANGVYDPYITGGGHQPRGWDQLIQMYNSATVIASKITLHCGTQEGAADITYSISLRDTSTAITDPKDVFEYGNAQHLTLSRTGSGDSIGVLTSACNPNQFLGIKNPMDAIEVRNSDASNPSKLCYWHVNLTTLGNSDTSDNYYRLILEYQVIFSEPNQPVVS